VNTAIMLLLVATVAWFTWNPGYALQFFIGLWFFGLVVAWVILQTLGWEGVMLTVLMTAVVRGLWEISKRLSNRLTERHKRKYGTNALTGAPN
jgi:hypothetical protein